MALGFPRPRAGPGSALVQALKIAVFSRRSVYFGGLDVDIQEHTLSDECSKFGKCSVWLARNPPGKSSRRLLAAPVPAPPSARRVTRAGATSPPPPLPFHFPSAGRARKHPLRFTAWDLAPPKVSPS